MVASDSEDRAHKDVESATALVEVLGDTNWEAVGLARGFLRLVGGENLDAAAREAYDHGVSTIKSSRERLKLALSEGLVSVLKPRERTGSAENPVTKLFPATVIEQRFLDLADEICEKKPALSYSDDRESGHVFTDFTLYEGDSELPINVKHAGTRFERAADLVGLDPDDCVPIPAYKANGAVEDYPSLLYVVSVDYSLIGKLQLLLPTLFDSNEKIVWELLNAYTGARYKKAEDAFVFTIVRRHWEKISSTIEHPPFFVASARKALRVLHTKPKRTPGIGLRAWGTGASAEVNVHLSVSEDMKPWEEVANRITIKGVENVIEAVNRKKQEWVYDPEI